MRIGEAYSIFEYIDSDKYTAEEKGLAIRTVLDMETHNSITKLMLMKVLGWLWSEHFEIQRYRNTRECGMRVINQEDLIAAIDSKLDKTSYGYALQQSDYIFRGELLEFIRSFPSSTIEQEQRKGTWVVVDKGMRVTKYKCSECGRIVIDDSGYDAAKDYPFCHCGADMRT